MVPAGYVEVISIPAYSAPGEWQGTMLFYKYASNGSLLDEYIADVILLPDPTYTYWDAILEVTFDDTDIRPLPKGGLSIFDLFVNGRLVFG